MSKITIGHSPKNNNGRPSQYVFTRWHVLTEAGEFLCGRVSSMPVTDIFELPQEAFGENKIVTEYRDRIPKRYREIYPNHWADFYTCFGCYQKLNPKPKIERLLPKPKAKEDTRQLNLW